MIMIIGCSRVGREYRVDGLAAYGQVGGPVGHLRICLLIG